MNLKVEVQNYDWGKKGNSSFVAQLVKSVNDDFLIDETAPYAELWMGTHRNGPSKLAESNKNLSEFIEQNPKCLGENVCKKFGNQLPYLFKVLSIAKALSIQAHPDKKFAEELHRKRPDLYKDPNHKPELAISITPFEALCGFRPVHELKLFFQTIPELIVVIGKQNIVKFLTSDEVGLAKALQDCFHSLMTQNQELVSQQLQLLINRIATLVTGVNTQAIERSWLDAKIRILKKMRGIPNELFQSHLHLICWKELRKDADDLFLAFLNDILRVYR